MTEPKVTKQDILNASSQMLNKDLYVVFTKPTNGLGPVMENIEEHLKFTKIETNLEPNKKGLKPSWNTITLSNDVFHKYSLPLLISGDGNSPLHINQNVKIYGGKIKNTTINHEIMGKAYVLMSSETCRAY